MLLSVITFLPALGALVLLFITGKGEAVDNLSRWIALGFTVATAALSLWLWYLFDPTTTAFQFVENIPFSDSIGYRMGVDGISVLFIPLTAVLMPAVVLTSWGSITKRVKEYLIVFLILETFMIGAFATLDLAIFGEAREHVPREGIHASAVARADVLLVITHLAQEIGRAHV